MFVGTGSDVGKSIINAGFCRIFKQDGYQPAPFKAQNMSLNSYATPQGLEIGRAQAVQAEACQIPCHTDMNPILLKPTNDKSSQVVLNGKPVGTQSAVDYFMGDNKHALLQEAIKSFHRLESKYNPIVMEGAGSISELNLKKRDITNMRMAIEADAATYLVADIDRGGVFASVYGSIHLLEPQERKQIKGILINKFRGDIRLFEQGKKILEELTGVPVIGILPYFRDIHIEDEDSVSLDNKPTRSAQNKINIAVIRLPRMSNFTDFNVLEHDPRVHLYFSDEPAQIQKAQIIIIPGSKNTISDLIALHNNGVARTIIQAHKDGTTVIGICGGYQMMGQEIRDPYGVEGDIVSVNGLGLLPVSTTIQRDKITQQCSFRHKDQSSLCHGYEIHMGQTHYTEKPSPLNILENGQEDGYFANDTLWGSYIHGILDNPSIINNLLSPFQLSENMEFDYTSFKETQYNKLAKLIRQYVDMEIVYSHLKHS